MMKAKLLLISLVVFTAAACSDEQEELNSWMNQTQQEAKAKLKPPEEPAPVERVTYNIPAPINPHAFSELRMKANMPVVTQYRPDLNRPKELLEKVGLDKLQFVGTIGSGNVLSALINHDNHVYTVKTGNYMGENFGRVSKITPDEITLVETVEDANGNWVRRQTIMALGGSTETKK